MTGAVGDGEAAATMVAGVDLGASNLRVAVADRDGEVVTRSRDRTPRGPDGAAVEAALVSGLRSACAGAGVEPADLEGVAVASPGPLDREAGTVEGPANLPGADRVRLRAPLEALGCGPVRLLNDATAGVVGERAAADPAPADLVYLSLSTGIGAGACVDGHVLSGRGGNAGEVGHLTVDPDGRRTCGCGRPGHWEAYCSGANVPGYARDLHDWTGAETSLPLGEGDLSAADVFDAAGADPLADRVIESVVRWNAVGLAAVVHAYDPAEVVLGGAVALRNQELVVCPLRERLPDAVLGEPPAVRTARLGEDAAVHGAVAVAVGRGLDSR